ncbi:hypothetical protein [Nonomuraea insulae]|uniref:DUF4145 domain-containing protein n=1 Tax=Nonomuraea insulae TaxID=1616787 RepID=A0ABW1CC33_9ACTN
MVEINKHVINNGLDFLESAVELLGTGDKRDTKYAALHLSASIETLLKVRLAREHWTLVVADPAKAQRTKYETGDVKSVSIDQALDRLTKIANVAISAKDLSSFQGLGRVRNQIAHFALIDDDPLATQATVARAMEALIRFIEQELAPGADAEEQEIIDATYTHVMEQIHKIKVLVRERMKALTSTIAQTDLPVVKCPQCLQDAYLFADGSPGACLFCSYEKPGDVAADDYASGVLGESEYRTVKHGGRWIITYCHNCSTKALVEGIVTVGAVEATHGCFACGYSGDLEDLEECTECGEWVSAKPDMVALCTNCWDRKIYTD